MPIKPSPLYKGEPMPPDPDDPGGKIVVTRDLRSLRRDSLKETISTSMDSAMRSFHEYQAHGEYQSLAAVRTQLTQAAAAASELVGFMEGCIA